MLKANKGDLVRILESAMLGSSRLKVGDIVEISKVFENFEGDDDCSLYYIKGASFRTGDNFYLCEDEFELFRKAGEEDVEKCPQCGEFKRLLYCDGQNGDITLYCSEYCADKAIGRKTELEQALDELQARIGEQAESDAVHHPSHYTQGKFETIEIIEAITQGYDDGYVAYSVGNALKYLARAPFKHASPIEDLRKASTYLEFAIKAYEAKEAE